MKKYLILILLILIPFIVLAYPKGDVDGNNKVGSADYVLVRKHILKQSILTGDKLGRADVNGDGKVTSLDYIVIRKILINGIESPTPIPTNTPIPKYEVTYYGMNVIETDLPGTITLEGSVKTPTISSKKIALLKNTKYAVSFDYRVAGGTNKFVVDLYPDDLPQIILNATTNNEHYDWELSSELDNMGNCQLRFFDDQQEDNEKDIVINNVMLGTYSKETKSLGETLSLPTPKRSGYKFVGWFTSVSGGTQVTNGTKVTGNMKLYAHWVKSVDIVLLWGQSNMVGSVGKSFEKGNNSKKLKNIDADIVANNESYGRVKVQMPAGVAYEYMAATNKLVDISTNPTTSGENFYYVNGRLSTAGSGRTSLNKSIGTTMIPYFAKEYYEKTGNTVIYVHAARGAYKIGDFLPSASTGSYQSMVLKFKKAENYIKSQGYEINNKFYVVYQGESDMYKDLVNKYANTYKQVHDNLKKDLGLSFGAMVYMVRGDQSCKIDLLKAIREQQKKLVKENNDIIMGTDFLYKEYCEKGNDTLFGVKDTKNNNRIHINSAALSQIGRDIARNIVASGKLK